MVARVARALSLALLATVGSSIDSKETAIEKVVAILQTVRSDVEHQHATEAALHSNFTAFCEENKAARTAAVSSDEDQVSLHQATVDQKAAEIALLQNEQATRQQAVNSVNQQLSDHEAQCSKERAEYEATSAQVSKAMTSLTKAIGILHASSATSFAQAQKLLKENVALASSQQLQALLQVDPSNPEYQSQVGGPIEVLQNMLSQFTEQKNTQDEQWAKSKQACSDMTASLESSLSSENQAVVQLTQSIGSLRSQSGEAKRNRGISEDGLNADSAYLRDLTLRCEQRAADWTERSATLQDELKAIDAATAALTSPNAALLQTDVEATPVPAKSGALIQSRVVKAHSQLRGRHSKQELHERVVAILNAEAKRLSNPKLAALAKAVETKPFEKIKAMINELINRLHDEALEETTKKAYCDKETKKATTERSHKMTRVQMINADIAALLAQNDTLPAHIQELGQSVSALQANLAVAVEQNQNDTAAAETAISEASAGITAVDNATDILTGFLQVAKGRKQSTSGGLENVVEILKKIKSDFEKTVSETKREQKKASASFVLFQRTSEADIAAKRKEIQANTQDLAMTKDELVQKMNDLESASRLVDDAVKTLEELKPMCITSGMTYAQRVAAREQEKQALQSAICTLDENNVEPDCVATVF